jgi:hypothetical protein
MLKGDGVVSQKLLACSKSKVAMAGLQVWMVL